MMFSLVLTFNHQKSKLRKHLGTGGLGNQKKGHEQQTGLNHQKIKPTKKMVNEKKYILPSQTKICQWKLQLLITAPTKWGLNREKKAALKFKNVTTKHGLSWLLWGKSIANPRFGYPTQRGIKFWLVNVL